MENLTPFKAWMSENGYTNKTLAQKLGCSYELIYKLSKGERATDRFKWQFSEMFGVQLAKELFEPATPEIEAVN